MNRSMIRRVALLSLIVSIALGVFAPLTFAQEDTARTILDGAGREVTLEAPPQNIIGMSKSINEMLFAIGADPVGVTAGMEYPPAALDVTVIGSGYAPALELIAGLEPDLIVANGQLQMEILPQLEDIAPTIVITTLVPADVVSNIRLLGQATWQDTTAEYLANSLDNMLTLAQTVGASQANGQSTMLIVGTLDQPNYGKSSTYPGALLQLLGLTNIAENEPDDGPFPGYAQLSIEAILEADPDVIFTITRGADIPMSEAMADDPIWSALTAVENGRAYELDYKIFLESPGPRMPEALTILYNMLYGAE